MEIGIVGLGRTGGNVARRLARAGVRVVGFDADAATRMTLQRDGIVEAIDTVRAFATNLAAPRVVWLAVPAGATTELVIEDVWPELARGDAIVDSGNAQYKDSQRRAAAHASAGIHFVDCGMSGAFGLDDVCTLMYGGTAEAARLVLPYMKILAAAEDRGHLHCGAPGAGHFVRMIHGGIECGMMQAYAEGFALLENRRDLALDLAAIAQTWRHGSGVRSSLLDLAAEFLDADAALATAAPVIADSDEERWTIQEAIEQGVPAPMLSLALMTRLAGAGRAEYAAKMLAMMRARSGGHAVHPAGGAKP